MQSYIKKKKFKTSEKQVISLTLKTVMQENFLLPQGAAEIATPGALENREKKILQESKLNKKKLHQEALEKSCCNRKISDTLN